MLWDDETMKPRQCSCGSYLINMVEPYVNKPFDTPKGFFTIMEEGPRREWWGEFMDGLLGVKDLMPDGEYLYYIPVDLINPSRMAHALLEFLEGR